VICAAVLYHSGSKFVKAYAEKFAHSGLRILAYDHRGHGRSAEITGKLNYAKMMPKIYTDIHDIISWILENQSDRLLDEKIALFGRSLGGAIILTHGFIDERAKVLIPLCTRYDYATVKIKFPQELIEKMSPKYFLKKDQLNNKRILLGHCKDDERIPFDNVLQIKEHLGLNDENVMIFDTGGHSFAGYREEVFERALEFLKKSF
jgi:esterase/lipase